LDFSKSESGAIKIEAIPFSVHRLLNDVKSMFSNPKGLEFRVTTDSLITSEVVGDSFKLQQCLTNLLSNAEKFTYEGFIIVDCRSEKGMSSGSYGILTSKSLKESG
jgi:signal transduction histidine kinase